jgi:dTDP-4-amino-4,6-dideoxygalactose transaminase
VAGVSPGDEVITTPLTFCASANVIVHRGARPVFVDVDRDSGLMDPELARKAITKRTKAILPVHLYGQACEMDELMETAERHGLLVVEDAAHAVETWHRGRKVGTIGHLTSFSFYVTKNLTTGEGGMLVTANDDWAEQIRIKRLHGISRDAWKRYSQEGFQPYDVIAAGYKCNMMDIQAALGIHQLARLEENLEIRRRHWETYNKAFEGLDEIRALPTLAESTAPKRTRHARHLYTILLDLDRLTVSRHEFMNAMKAENVGTGIHFVALNLTSFYQKQFGSKRGDCPRAEFISDRTVSLPLSSALTRNDVNDVIRAVTKVLEAYRKR